MTAQLSSPEMISGTHPSNLPINGCRPLYSHRDEWKTTPATMPTVATLRWPSASLSGCWTTVVLRLGALPRTGKELSCLRRTVGQRKGGIHDELGRGALGAVDGEPPAQGASQRDLPPFPSG